MITEQPAKPHEAIDTSILALTVRKKKNQETGRARGLQVSFNYSKVSQMNP